MPIDSVVTLPAEVDRCILSAVDQVLEKMFFTCIESTGSDGEIETDKAIQVEIGFSGPLCGRFRLRLGEDAARALGSTLTCIEEAEFARDRCVLVAGELANMICGSILSQLEPEANISLRTPCEIDDRAVLEGGIRRWFCLPEGTMAAEFAVAQLPCAPLE